MANGRAHHEGPPHCALQLLSMLSPQGVKRQSKLPFALALEVFEA